MKGASQLFGNDTSDSCKILIFPEFEKLREEVEKLRTELSMLVLERDNLLFQECKNIEMAYMLSVGGLEYKAYEIECSILRLKRKAELIQAKKNRQEIVILHVIDDILDSEFAEYQARLNEQVNKMNSAIERSHGKVLTDEEIRELKKLYRTIIKALHPDLHPELPEAKIRLFQNAAEAYEHGDLDTLRMIDAMVSEPAGQVENSDQFALLGQEKERLLKLLQTIKDKITAIKSEYPYTMKLFVHSPDKIELRKAELEDRIKQLNEVHAAYAAKIAEMLR